MDLLLVKDSPHPYLRECKKKVHRRVAPLRSRSESHQGTRSSRICRNPTRLPNSKMFLNIINRTAFLISAVLILYQTYIILFHRTTRIAGEFEKKTWKYQYLFVTPFNCFLVDLHWYGSKLIIMMAEINLSNNTAIIRTGINYSYEAIIAYIIASKMAI